MYPPIEAEVGAVEYVEYGASGAFFAMLGHGGMVSILQYTQTVLSLIAVIYG